MKLLILVAGLLALTSAHPLQTAEQELTSFEVDQLFADEQTSLDEVKKQLKERFDEVLDKIRDAIESGKALKGDFLEKAKEIREKLRDLKVDVGEKGRNLLERIREKGKEFFKELLDKLGLEKEKREIHAEMMADEYGDIVSQLKNKFEEVSKRVKDAFEQGKALKEGLDQLQEIRKKLKEYNIDFGGQYQEFLDKIKDKVKDYWNKLKEKLTSKRNAGILKEVELEKRDVQQDLQDRLQDYIHDINENMMLLQNKFMRLTNWMQTAVVQSLTLAQSNFEQAKTVAKDAVEKSRNTTSAIKKIYETDE